MRASAGVGPLVAATALTGWAVPGFTAELSCTRALGGPAASAALTTHGVLPATAQLSAAPGRSYLIQVDERDNDALVEVVDARDRVIARADHPERRTGTRRIVLKPWDAASLLVRVTGKEHAGALGKAYVKLFDLATLKDHAACLAVMNDLAAGDAEYAAGQEISRGRANSTTGNARDHFSQAARAYAAAAQGLAATADQTLLGRTQLAVAGVDYSGLQEWKQAAELAQTAARTIGPDDPYRRARAEELLAAAWIEMGAAGPATGLLARARQQMQRLVRFHLQRGENYDAALQLTYIGVTYLDEGSYSGCVEASSRASRLFDSLHETQRRAAAWHNEALCLWGLGRLPEALRRFELALNDIGSDPSLYGPALTDTALLHYAVGHYDESLRLYDRALAFTRKAQASREEAYCLYGIGVNYYALGDRERARQHLEESLAIRTVALDGRGRMASLRSLATIYGEDEGTLKQALAADAEALGLAVAPSAIARIKIQQAVHIAADGRAEQARAQLDEVVSSVAKTGPAIQAEALLQRAVLLRSLGRPREALADLAAARPGLHTSGSVLEEFEGDLELARALKDLGQSHQALAAVERALGQADAVRLQTANPELRAQLQTPLRPAYDLKLELLRERYERALATGNKPDARAIAMRAFTTADASRARSFAELAAENYSPGVRRTLAVELRRREDLYRALSARRFTLDSRLERSGLSDPRVRHLVADIAELRREVDTVNTDIARRVQSHGAAPRGARSRMGVPTLPADTALVSYWLGSESAYAWVLLPAEVQWVRLPPPKVIAGKVNSLHESLTRSVDMDAASRLQDARALYATIVQPIEPWLAPVRRWLIIPDGALDYVPFAALRTQDGRAESFVVTQHDVAVTPAAWMLDQSAARPPAQRRGILLVADPVYQADDPRMPKAKDAPPAPKSADSDDGYGRTREYQRLPFSAQEAAGIAALFPPTEVDELTGLDATRARLLAMDWSQYQFIHIATHGVVDAQVPELSALILGSFDARGPVADRAVRVADVSLRKLTADVAVLSGCETALGKEVRSDGLVGMSSTMLARGARAVVASLWPVPDEIGARLMTELYQHMLHDSMDPEAALGAAMRSMLLRDPAIDPALWAAFQVSVGTLHPPASGRDPATVRAAGTTTP